MKYEITYISYAGRTVFTEVEAEDEDSAIEAAYNQQTNYSSNDIHEIILVDLLG